jgi:hypothetical protein
MQAPIDLLARQKQQMEEQAAAGERAYRSNVNRFIEMWLSLGSDVTKLEGTRHDGELLEARGLAAHRWGQLLGMEEQIGREEQRLAARPKTRPAQPGDETLPDRTLEQRNADWQVQTKDIRAGLADLKEQAKRERRELESFTKGR